MWEEPERCLGSTEASVARVHALAPNFKPIPWERLSALCICICTCASVAWGQNDQTTVTKDGWRLSLGVGSRQLGRTSISAGRTHAERSGIAINGTGNTIGGTVGAENGAADREYNDGYVRQDDGTPSDGNTWYWGYENAEQYNSGSQTLSLHASDLVGSESAARGVEDDSSDFNFTLEVSADRPFSTWHGLTLLYGFDLSLAFVDFNTSWEGYRQDAYDVTDSYNIAPIDPPGSTIPPWTPPYHGDPSGPGPIISIDPDAGRTATHTHSGISRVRLDADLIMLDIGAHLGLEKSFNRLRIGAFAGASLGLVYTDADRRETFRDVAADGSYSNTLGRWKDDRSDIQWVPQLSVGIKAEYRVTERIWIGANLQWNEALSDVDLSVGPDSVNFDLDGCSVGLMVGLDL